jgi:hypothetical protein
VKTAPLKYMHANNTQDRLMISNGRGIKHMPQLVFPTSEPDQALDLTGLNLDSSLKSSGLMVIKPNQAEKEAGLSSMISLVV